MFQTTPEMMQEFGWEVSVMISSYPTRDHINKALIGGAVEDSFCDMVKKFCVGVSIEKCPPNERRNDLIIEGQKFSVKYSTPNKNGRIPPIRLINSHTTTDKIYITDEDIILVVRSSAHTQFLNDNSRIYNPDSKQFVKKYGKNGKIGNTAKMLLEQHSENDLLSLAQFKYSGKIIFIPKTAITAADVVHSRDGVDLSAKFINKFVENIENRRYIAQVDIKFMDHLPEVNLIKVAKAHVGINR